MNLRNRVRLAPSSRYTPFDFDDKKLRAVPPLHHRHFLGVFLFLLLTFLAVVAVEKRLPEGLKLSDEPNNPNRFIAERAHIFLRNLTELGPRIAGSYVNEVQAVQLLTSEIENVIKNAHENHIIEIDVQKTSGDFNLGFLDGLTNVYRNLQNVVVRFRGKTSTGAAGHSLLINCHFDSAVDSPGASDDGAGCAVMLEILRVLSHSPESFPHSIIFLFNGGEENFLPASHGFITQHKWAKQVRAFINLEACGAGGREFLFQAGPHHPWILDIYSKEVPYPYASSAAKEIFQSGLIPADTDYRIFRDFGNVSGVDFAWAANGYVYHTKFDTIEQVPMGSLQRTGDNILALAKGIVKSGYLSGGEEYKRGELLFFDVLGVFILRTPVNTAKAFSFIVLLASFLTIHLKRERHDVETKQYYKNLFSCTITILAIWVTSIGATISIAFVLTLMDKTMSWYARPWWILFLYAVPALFVYMTTLILHSKDDLKTKLPPWRSFQFYHDATQLLWSTILVLGLITGTHFFLAALIWTLFASIRNILQPVSSPRKDRKWLITYICIMFYPFVQCSYWTLALLYLFIPTMGRIGAGNHGEVLVAVITTVLFLFLSSFIVPLILLVHEYKKILLLTITVFLVSVAVLFLTPFGFAYSDDPKNLAPQRYMISHTKRTFHDGFNTTEKTGYWVVDMDSNSLRSVEEHVPEATLAQSVDKDCIDHLYCGMPYLVSALTFYWKTHWIPGPEPNFYRTTNVEVTKEEPPGGRVRFGVHIQGSAQMAVMISPVQGVELTEWSLESKRPMEGPKWNGRNTYFVYFAHGLESVPFNFSMDFQIPNSHSGPVMEFAVSSQFLFEPGKSSDDFKEFVAKFPSWTAVAFWTASYESWIL